MPRNHHALALFTLLFSNVYYSNYIDEEDQEPVRFINKFASILIPDIIPSLVKRILQLVSLEIFPTYTGPFEAYAVMNEEFWRRVAEADPFTLAEELGEEFPAKSTLRTLRNHASLEISQ
jgi:hypothetical protein